MDFTKKARLTIRCFEAHFIDEAVDERLKELGYPADDYYKDEWNRLDEFQDRVKAIKKRICKI